MTLKVDLRGTVARAMDAAPMKAPKTVEFTDRHGQKRWATTEDFMKGVVMGLRPFIAARAADARKAGERAYQAKAADAAIGAAIRRQLAAEPARAVARLEAVIDGCSQQPAAKALDSLFDETPAAERRLLNKMNVAAQIDYITDGAIPPAVSQAIRAEDATKKQSASQLIKDL